MLRSSVLRLRERVSQQYVCWECLSRTQSRSPSNTIRRASNIAGSSRSGVARLGTGRRQFNAGRAVCATIEPQSASALPAPPPILNTRDRLRQWELENADVTVPDLADINETLTTTEVFNGSLRTQTNEFLVEGVENTNGEDGVEMLPFDFGLVDVGLRRSFMLPGDMVEILSASGQRRELAIFVQGFKKQSQFYTMSGRWLHKSADLIRFFVPNFVETAELKDIKPWLPKEDLTEELVDRIQAFDFTDVPRNLGRPLIKKMLAFAAKADEAYQASAVQMDNCHELVAHPSKFTYATLRQIADKVLDSALPRMEDGTWPYPTLYALHRNILTDDIGFGSQGQQLIRGESEYEIHALREVRSLRRIIEHVRAARTDRIAQRRGSKDSLKDSLASRDFNLFVTKARRIIDRSRENRKFTECGVLGPSTKQLPEGSNFRKGELTEAEFSDVDYNWIYFLESWACLKSFSLYSGFNGIGSSILRAIGRYNDVPLNKTTAFTCLMELGVIEPWQTQSAFELRLPYASLRFTSNFNTTHGVIPDQMAGLRKDWGGLQVYCVDDTSAFEIDDGFSVEPTENPEEYWIHVHVADPASHLHHDSKAAKHAESLISSVYLPDRMISMFSKQWTSEKLSLGPKRPCLTHSIKLNSSGEILDVNITPSIINNVAYLTGDTLHEAIFETPPPSKTHLVVGHDTFEEKPSRPILGPQDLSTEQTKDLKLLYKLSQAKQKIQVMKGSIQHFNSEVEAQVSFGGARWKIREGYGAHYNGDPTIRISIPPINEQGQDINYRGGKTVVATMMLLAGEAAARWSHARGIPVIYRVSPFNPDGDNPLEYYERYILPSLMENGSPELEVAMGYLRLIGKTQPSTTPGPHLGIGADMVIQCTSPLRRFGDVLNQWQMEAALREEAATGTSLVGNTRDDFLPFSKARIDALIPRLAERERILKQGQKTANREWILQYLVRAWKFGEDKLASPFLFYTRSFDPRTRFAGGLLPSCQIGGTMQVPEDIKAEDIKIGDVFEVDIKHIDVYESRLELSFVRRVPESELSELDPALAESLKAVAER